jgi:hypothetical protein
VIKLFHDGAVPEGSERGWHVTSKIIHKQVGPTFTIESFTEAKGLSYKAVVSRFIPGKSLRELFEKWNKEDEQYRKIISRDFSKTLIPSLLDVLEACHYSGFGHGDLHEGNVMVFPTNYGTQNKFSAVLIDFDNSSIKTELIATSEKEKIEKDIRLVKRIINYIIMEWHWNREIEPVYKQFDAAADLNYAWKSALRFIQLIDDGEFDQAHIYEHIKPLTVRATGGLNIQPLLESYRNIAATMGQSALFEAAFNQLFIADTALPCDKATRHHQQYWSFQMTSLHGKHH